MVKLLLLRHGMIRANREGRWHGSTDSPLIWRGRRQAKRTARHLSAAIPGLDAIYSSPLQRCRDTASAVGARFKLDVNVHPELREYCIGEWEDLPFSHLAQQHRFIERATTDHDFAPPGGETLRQVSERIVHAIQEIHAWHEDGQRVLLVSHGAALAVALGALLDDNPGSWVNYQFANCGLTELVLSPAPYVNFFNATHHL